jgi:ATP-dependent Clp protease ATP-binding subunit ClpB
MTSNIGSGIIQNKFQDFGNDISAMESAKIEVLGLLKKMVRPEFLNRIDDTILFSPLNEKDIESIVELQLKHLAKTLQEQGVIFDSSPEAIRFLAKKGYQPEYGARPVKRVIQKEVLNALSKKLLSGTVNSSSIILMDAFDDTLVFRNQNEKIPKKL